MKTVRHVGVIGAGMVGLSTAWFLQDRGVQVTVLDKAHPGAGASWGNAGWLTPELTTPLPHPAVLASGLRALFASSSPVYVPPSASPRLLAFLASFARHSTHRKWAAAMRDFAPMNLRALDAFERMAEGGVEATTYEADPFLACYRSVAERDAMLTELEQLRSVGQDVKVDVIDREELHRAEPTVSAEIKAAIRIHGQRYLNPPQFVDSLAEAVHDRLGTVVGGAEVTDVQAHNDHVRVLDADGVSRDFDAVVLANGAWLSGLARRFGVRKPVQAGRGYSFSVTGERLPHGPVYFPSQRVACTPLQTSAGRRLRVAGMMEFRAPDAPLDQRRVRAIVDAVSPLLPGADFDNRQDEWVGSRPCTADGLPLVGGTKSPRVFVAGGHGMWGIAWGPLTGELLAHRIVTGYTPAQMAPFDPLR